MGSYDRLDLLDCGRRVPQLYGDQHEIGDVDRRRIVGRWHLREVKGLRSPLDGQSLRAHRLQMGATRHEMDVGPAGSEPAAEIAADPSRSHHHDLHDITD